ncbi:MAG: hypothetical protein IPM25_14830 [Chloracidobacterium sp.]|nr:hypothetical protein [Chloracidobacterium sp.]
MAKVFLAFCVTGLLSVSLFGQSSKNDIERLKTEVGLPASTMVVKQRRAVSKNDPTKIFFLVDDSRVSEDDFRSWVDQWNTTKAANFGALQIVSKISEADVAAVLFRSGVAKVVREESVGLNIGRAGPKTRNNDVTVLTEVGNSRVNAKSSVRTLPSPIYTYLIVQGANSAWHLNYARVDEVFSENPFPERRLQSVLENALKDR